MLIIFLLLNLMSINALFTNANNYKKNLSLNIAKNLSEDIPKKIFNLDKDLFETHFYYDFDLINLDLIDKYTTFYFIIGPKNIKNNLLIEDMKNYKKTGIFVNKNSFSKETLDLIYKKYIDDSKYLCAKNSWIFDDNSFIGDITDFYKKYFY